MYAYELYEENKPQIVVTYPGRFQPFHQGHAGVFEILQRRFGSENVYILTSNDTSSTKSPFNFSDKYQLMTAAGVPGNKIIETNKMYTLPPQFDTKNNIFITVVGGPDADRLNPDSYTKKDQKDKDGNVIKPAGSPSYYQTLREKETPVTADKHGYVVVIPELQKRITLGGETYDVSHGTDTRNVWNKIRNKPELRKEFLTTMYKYPHSDLGNIFDKIQQTTSEDIASVSTDTASPISGKKINEDMDSIDIIKKSIRKFIPIAMKVLKLSDLPKIKFKMKIDSDGMQSSFGQYMPENNMIVIGCADRHPVDILRTLAHELVHYKQHLTNELDDKSGITGSDEENDANARAGVIMRHYNKNNPSAIDN
jgi:nicotinamide mononucleotide adenylyltransferase